MSAIFLSRHRIGRNARITLAEMRSAGVRGVLIYCSDYWYSVDVIADQWPDDVTLNDVESRFVCSVCGRRQAASYFGKRSVGY